MLLTQLGTVMTAEAARAGKFVSLSLSFAICKMKISLDYQVLEEAGCLGWGYLWGWHKERHSYPSTLP